MQYDYIEELYEKVAVYEDLRKKAEPSDLKRLNHTVLKLKSLLKPNIKILEIGPGSGFITTGILEQLIKFKVNYYALDLSRNFLLKTYNSNFDKKNFIYADICDPKFSLNLKFDLILFQEVLEHLPAPYQAMVNINLLLKQNGILFLTTPNTYKFSSQFELLYRKPKIYFNTHIAEFSPLGLLKLITMSGFEPIELHFYNNKFKFMPNLLKQFTSSEVNIIAKKVATPEKQWRILTKTILRTQNNNSHH